MKYLALTFVAIVCFLGVQAFAQITTPLPGRNVVKLLPDYSRPKIYALNQGSGSAAGTLLALNPTNGSILGEISLNLSPTDMAATRDGNTLYVINTGSRTVSRVDLDSFSVVSSQPISTPNTYDPSNPLHLALGQSNLIYYTDGAWAPNLYILDFNSGTTQLYYNAGDVSYIDYNSVETPDGIGGLTLTADGKTLYSWLQYGWSAGYAYSVITRFAVNATNLQELEFGPLQGRGLFDTPVLLDGSQKWVFNKQQKVSATNVSALLTQFPDNIYAISLNGSVAFGPTEMFNAQTGGLMTNLPFSTPVETLSSDQTELIRYDPSATNLVIYMMSNLDAVAEITNFPIPANGAAVGLPITNLAWSGSSLALAYDVYFGTNSAQIASATTGSSVYLGRAWSNSMPQLQSLTTNTTYYWRVDTVGFTETNIGSVWSFTISPISINPLQVIVNASTGNNPQNVTLNLTSSAPVSWSAAVTGSNWLALAPASGTSPTNTLVSFNTASLSSGQYSNNVEFTVGALKMELPVTLNISPLNNPTKMIADYQRPYIYVIQPGLLLLLNTLSGSIDKTIAIGSLPLDLSINYPESRLYIADNSGANPPIYVVDLNAQVVVTNFSPIGMTAKTINAIAAGSIIAEGSLAYILNTTNGTVLSTTFVYDGSGKVDPTGTYYYHCDDNNSAAHVYKFLITNDTLVNIANGPDHAYGDNNLVMSHDGSRLFWDQFEYDANVNQLGSSGAEIYACTSNGALAFSSTQVFDTPTLTPFYNLPANTSIMAVDGAGQNLWYYNSASNRIQSLPLSAFQVPPVITHNPTNQSIYSGNNALIGVSVAGPSPMSFYWFLNGTNVAVTTNSQLIVSNMQASTAGNYSVLVSNAYGTAISSSAALSVQFVPPFIVAAPTNVTQIIGSNATLSVSVAGSMPVSYQWQFAGTDIGGATNSVLLLTNLQIGEEGCYDVIISNAYGSITSSNACLNVIDMAEALNTTNLVWTSAGDQPWFVETSITEDGFAALQSGPIISNQQSIVQTTVNGPGTLTFWWNVSSEANNDYLSFSVNGTEQSRISGVTTGGFYGWTLVTNYLPGGPQTLDWAYVKTDSGVSTSGRDSGWLDEVSYLPGGTAPFFLIAPTNQVVLLGSNVAFSASASGTPTLSFQWRFNLTNIDGATSSSLTITNAQYADGGNYDLEVSNSLGVTDSTPVLLYVVGVPEALNATNLAWSSGGNAAWFAETATTHDGVAALQSGPISSNQQSIIQTTVNGPGTLSFWWNASSHTNSDYLSINVNSMEQARISGQSGWRNVVLYLGTGPQTVLWEYVKTDSIVSGQDAGWLDQVTYTAGASAPAIITGPTNETVFSGSTAVLQVTATGTPPLNCNWSFDGTNLPGATNLSLSITNAQWYNSGSYQLVITNAYGSATSSIAVLTVGAPRIVAWGQNVYGQTNVPTSLTNPVAIAAGEYHSLALRADGTVVGWGNNSYGQVNVPANVTNAVSIAAGAYFSLALRNNGTVAGWGQNNFNEVSSTSNLTAIVAIAAGDQHMLALRSNGTVSACGYNSNGQTNVPPGLTNVAAIAAGGNSSYALLSNGTVLAWGNNTAGETNVPAGLANVASITAGYDYCLALKTNGTIVGWGNNSGAETNILASLSNILAVSSHYESDLALRNNGTVFAWGQNGNGQTNVPPNLADVASIACGYYHSLALVVAEPPIWVEEPQSQTLYEGATVLFAAQVLSSAPTSYQWQFNGSSLPTATNVSLVLSSLQTNNAGSYTLIVSNIFGSATSSNAALQVLASTPIFLTQPTNLSEIIGSNATFSASVAGSLPISFQWQFNGTNISGATNGSFVLTNVQLVSQGTYDLVASNTYGSTTSSNVALSLISLTNLAEVLNDTNLVFTSTGSTPWVGETTLTHDGVAAAQSTAVSYSSQSVLSTTITGPGTLSFWWENSAQSADTLAFKIGGTNMTSLAVPTPWKQQTFYLGSGAQVLQWVYTINYPATSSNYVVALDQVSFVPGGTAPFFVASPTNATVGAGNTATFTATGTGTPPLSYQWQFNSVNIANATNSSFSITDAQAANQGTYTLIISNGYGPIANASATLTVTATLPTITSQPANWQMVPGGYAHFQISAKGSEPLSYQWSFNGANLSGATNSILHFPGVQPANAGNYQVLISNTNGSVLSSNASLTLAPSVVVAWGASTAPYGLTNAVAISANNSGTFALTLRSDGTVIGWGDDSYGQTSIPAGLSNVVAIAAGEDHSLAVVSSGSVAAWGDNSFGECNVPTGLSNVVAVAAGLWSSMALKNDGTIVGWGWNQYGQTTPPAGLTNVQAISGGQQFYLALQSNGVVQAWGWMGFGETSVPSGLSNAVAIAAGQVHAIALNKDHVITGWGFPGDNDLVQPASLTDPVAIAAGYICNLGLQPDGTVIGWGNDDSGDIDIPVGLTNAVAIALSENFGVAILNSGSPAITWQPFSQTAYTGQTVQMTLGATGSQPLNYQWQLNNTNIPGATNLLLTLTNIPLTSAGIYVCVVSNAIGFVSSHPATLTVLRSTLSFDMATGGLQRTTNGFSLQLNGLSGHGNVVLYFSSDLQNWTPILTNPPVVGSLQLLDTNATNFPEGFYRAIEQ